MPAAPIDGPARRRGRRAPSAAVSGGAWGLLLALVWAAAPAGARPAPHHGGHDGPSGHSHGHRHGGPAAGAAAATKPAAAARPPAAADDAVEEVETVDLAGGDAAAAGTPQAGPQSASTPGGGVAGEPLTRTQVIAHLHPALVHLPIAWTILWAIWELLAVRWPATFRPGASVLAAATVLSFLPATLTGLLHLQELPEAADVRAPALLHRNLMYVGLAASIGLAALGHRWRTRAPPRAAVAAFIVTLWLQVGLIGYAAHLGGKMVYGDDYLPF